MPYALTVYKNMDLWSNPKLPPRCQPGPPVIDWQQFHLIQNIKKATPALTSALVLNLGEASPYSKTLEPLCNFMSRRVKIQHLGSADCGTIWHWQKLVPKWRKRN